MRRILVDNARSKGYPQAGWRRASGHARRSVVISDPRSDDFIASGRRAREPVAAISPRKAEVVELRFFGGLSVEETAEAPHVSPETVKRDWRFAKGWLVGSWQHCRAEARRRVPR